LGITPIWNEPLEQLCGAKWFEVESCYSELYELLEASRPEIVRKAESFK
jgi:hypothetical protein